MRIYCHLIWTWSRWAINEIPQFKIKYHLEDKQALDLFCFKCFVFHLNHPWSHPPAPVKHAHAQITVHDGYMFWKHVMIVLNVAMAIWLAVSTKTPFCFWFAVDELTMQTLKKRMIYFHSGSLDLLGETHLTTADMLAMKQLCCIQCIHTLLVAFCS